MNIRDSMQRSINYICNRRAQPSSRANESKTAFGEKTRRSDKLKKAKGKRRRELRAAKG